MDAVECIMTRRSIRKYTGDIVNEDMINTILKAAGNAPSGGNQQPWHFVVIKERALMKEAAGRQTFGANAAFLIAVCHDRAAKPKYEKLVLDDCSAAMQNIMLAAHALGLGACWIGVHHLDGYHTQLVKTINAPDSVWITGMAAIGWPAEEKEAVVRLKPEMVHVDKW